eukprot:3701456-Rhodomonas_salina.1
MKIPGGAPGRDLAEGLAGYLRVSSGGPCRVLPSGVPAVVPGRTGGWPAPPPGRRGAVKSLVAAVKS